MKAGKVPRLCVWVCWLVVMFAAGGVIHAQSIPGLLPVEEAYQLEVDGGTPGMIKLHWTIAPDYYLYRGQMQFSGGNGVSLGTVQLPDGEKTHDAFFGDVEIYRNGIDASIPYTLAAGTQRIQFSVNYQGCHEVDPKICYPPHTQNFDLSLPGNGAAGDVAAAGSLPDSSSVGAPRRDSLEVLDPGPQAAADAMSAGPAITAGRANGGVSAGGSLGVGLPLALLLAFAGGLVLNLMPCVLPVLAIKTIGLLESKESAARMRRHALGYAAGVLCSFSAVGIVIIALRSGGHVLGWGAQLQQPLVVGVLVCVMAAIGLSMSGAVHFGASLGNVGQGLTSRSGWTGDFFTGVLAVVVASPCVAPFMGTALAYAFMAPMLTALLVFLALGLGLALPFLLIGFVPALGRLLPKPGAWMETLKQFLAFPMYLTAVWLVWILAHQRGADAVALVLIAVVLLAMALWWHERSRYRGVVARAFAAIPVLIAIAPLYFLANLHPTPVAVVNKGGVVPFSPQKLAELRGAGTPVFVDMTADWCITCKANEHAVLDTSEFRDLLDRTGTVYMVGDWTNVDPVIGTFLQQYHSPGVPLYVVFPADGGAGKVLPNVLTASLVRNAVLAASH